MQWELVVALVIAIPIILFPVVFIWYCNIGGICALIKEARARRVARGKEAGPAEKNLEKEAEYQRALAEALKRFPW